MKLTAKELLLRLKIPRIPIPANCTADDGTFNVDFDARLYFEQASDAALVRLGQVGWGGDYEADDVAAYMADIKRHGQLVRLFYYVRKHDIGFECHVNEEAALKWLAHNRPHLLDKIPHPQ